MSNTKLELVWDSNNPQRYKEPMVETPPFVERIFILFGLFSIIGTILFFGGFSYMLISLQTKLKDSLNRDDS